MSVSMMILVRQGFLNAGVALASMGRYEDALNMCAHVLLSFKTNGDVIMHSRAACGSIMIKYGSDEAKKGRFEAWSS